jgi:hypothetical protein
MLAEPISSCSSSDAQFPPPPIDRAGRRLYYPLDFASVLSAAALRVLPGCSVLDVCAAPGGKSIAISQSLKSGGFLVCNEPDGERRRRLMASLKEHCRLLHRCSCSMINHLLPSTRFPFFFIARPSLRACVCAVTTELSGPFSKSKYRLKGEILQAWRVCACFYWNVIPVLHCADTNACL